MNIMFKFFLSIGWTKIDSFKVEKWILEKNIDLLRLTLKKGLYRERIQAIKGFRKLGDKSIIPDLFLVGRNDFEDVTKEAIKTLYKLENSTKHILEVEALEKYWKLRNQSRHIFQVEGNKEWMNKKEKMQKLENIKQKLRSPIGSGKWF